MVTKTEFNSFRSEVKKKLEHFDKNFEFIQKKFNEHDERFDRMESKLDNTIDIMQQMCDKVLKAHENFSVESVAIKDNYHQLETRVTKIEKIVFPNSSVA